MKAVVKHSREKGALAVREVDMPSPKATEVLIQVHCAAICGSDLHAYNYDPGYEFINVPVILGHELSGIVIETGCAVEGILVGDRVAAEASQYCGRCFSCLSGRTNICENIRITGLHKDGGMAEYVCVDARYIHKLPEGVGPLEGALVEPLSVAIHGVADNCRISPGDAVLVMGPGVIGLLAAQVSKLMGAGRVIVAGAEADAATRLPWAEKKGFSTICQTGRSLTEELIRVTGNEKVDIVLECSGNPEALQACFSVLRKGGQLTIMGLYARSTQIFITTAVRNEIVLQTSYSSLWRNYEQAIKLIDSDLVDVNTLVEKFPLHDAEIAFQNSLNKKVIKAVLLT